MTDSKSESQQADKFRDLARELECDEDEAGFEEVARRVATAPHSPRPHKDRKAG